MAVDDDKVMLSFQVSRTLLEGLDRIAAAAQLSRSDVARRALSLNLDAVGRNLGVVAPVCVPLCEEQAQ